MMFEGFGLRLWDEVMLCQVGASETRELLKLRFRVCGAACEFPC